MPTLRDGTRTSDAKLDRIVQFDPNSRSHPVVTERAGLKSLPPPV